MANLFYSRPSGTVARKQVKTIPLFNPLHPNHRRFTIPCIHIVSQFDTISKIHDSPKRQGRFTSPCLRITISRHFPMGWSASRDIACSTPSIVLSYRVLARQVGDSTSKPPTAFSRESFYILSAFPRPNQTLILNCLYFIPSVFRLKLQTFIVNSEKNIIMATTTATVTQSTSENAGKIAIAFDEKVHEGVSSLTPYIRVLHTPSADMSTCHSSRDTPHTSLCMTTRPNFRLLSPLNSAIVVWMLTPPNQIC